ncbi:PhaM family polyhydroxyalkanoate granule multifunctional regulatory protein [Variovorax sp. LT2P21]|uniref:PhaM family polyhydroxyalkanoate granule multifunctional regulatory protein n=1 Tax=Variovorax sp. LT2P21 TaxID=3443731 RepID=UPI003F4745B3
MNDATSPFAFSQFVPGFDFLKNLAGGANPGGGAVPGLPSLSNWVAPTLSVEEVDKRIQELKTVQYWLEQNGHALKATIQALEVQKMTLSTLRGMNVQMEDLAKAFTRTAAVAEPVEPPPAPPSAPAEAAAPEQAEAEPSPAESVPKIGKSTAAKPGVVDPLQWWNALTQQFQQIAQTAVEDAGQLKMPGAAGAPAARPAAAKRTTAKKAAAKKTTKTTARKTPAASRSRSR